MRVTIRLVSEMVVSIPSAPAKVQETGAAAVDGTMEDAGVVEVPDVEDGEVSGAAVTWTEVRATASVVASVGVGAGGAELQEVKSSAVTSAHPTIRISRLGN